MIWLDHYPKKIKIFFWELSLGAVKTADRLQCCMPYMSISPSWCIMCQSHVEPFASVSDILFWMFSVGLQSGLIILLTNNTFDLLAFLLVGHPFYDIKKTIWLAILRAFFWTLWGEHNKRLFRGSFSSFDSFMDLVPSTTLYWWVQN